MRKPRQAGNGFTLIELLVALAIVSVVAVLSWQGLENVIRLTDRVRTTDEELAQLRAVFGQFSSDLKNVPNPRGVLQTSVQGPAGGGSGEATNPPASTERNQMLQNEPRPDVTVEDESVEDERNLDAVVDELLIKGEKIQLLNDGMQIQTLQKSATEGLSIRLVSWRFEQGRMVRVSRALKVRPEDQDSNNAKVPQFVNAFAAEELPLKVAGLSVRLWSEGKGWTSERSFGAILPPPAENTEQTGQAVVEANGSKNTSLRTLGVELRVLMLSGKIYNRVFLVGSAS